MKSLIPEVVRSVSGDVEPWGRIRGILHHFVAKGGIHDDEKVLDQINSLETTFKTKSDSQLKELSRTLRSRVRSGESERDCLIEAFALVREASHRILGMRHYDAQILGGMVICRGQVAEMATGEGKTLVQSLAAYFKSLSGKGVHLATSNSYLAERDFNFAKPLYDFLETSVELLPERVPAFQKRSAFDADVTYGNGAEFGFDYLRDQMSLIQSSEENLGDHFRRELLGLPGQHGVLQAQRGLVFGIVDELDSVLIDEATTPLVISGRAGKSNPHPELYRLAHELAGELDTATEVNLEDSGLSVHLTEAGLKRIHEDSLVVPWQDLQRPWRIYVENALKARYSFQKDRDYIVGGEKTDEVVLVDGFTGRLKIGSTWREGLHQAVEAKEELAITAETNPVASISRQRFYRHYQGLGGMTGTAQEAAGELWRFYRLEVVSVRRHRPFCGEELPVRIFRNRTEKWRALSEVIRTCQEGGQPVLLGCQTIEESEQLAEYLRSDGIKLFLLNAKSMSEEAEIVARAGDAAMVTIATNMAGRGTDIVPDPQALEAGGLFVISTGMEEARRIDRQLKGRAARQGQPGSSAFYLSGDDSLLNDYLPDDARKLRSLKNTPGDVEVPAAKWYSRFQLAQRLAEKARYEQRVATFFHNELLNETKERLV